MLSEEQLAELERRIDVIVEKATDRVESGHWGTYSASSSATSEIMDAIREAVAT